MTDAELLSFYRFQATHWRNLAVRYQQELKAMKNIPESHNKGRTITYTDRTGNTAAARADKERR
jgi:hypothetical protein